MMRACLVLLVSVWLVPPAAAQTQQEGEMRLYIQQLEERVRQLTGENERLLYQVEPDARRSGQPPLQAGQVAPAQTGAVAPAPPAGLGDVQMGANLPPGTPPQDLGIVFRRSERSADRSRRRRRSERAGRPFDASPGVSQASSSGRAPGKRSPLRRAPTPTSRWPACRSRHRRRPRSRDRRATNTTSPTAIS